LIRRRLYQRSRFLRETCMKLIQLANSVGYDSDAVPNEAFKLVLVSHLASTGVVTPTERARPAPEGGFDVIVKSSNDRTMKRVLESSVLDLYVFHWSAFHRYLRRRQARCCRTMGRERKAEDPNGRETEDYFLCTSSTPSTKSPIPAKRSDCTAPSRLRTSRTSLQDKSRPFDRESQRR
jgi:hypothetical protein